MLNEEKHLDGYWRETIYTTVYVQNIGQLRVNSDKYPYDIPFGRPASVKYFRAFGSKCYIKRDDDNLGKFDSRSNEGIFLGYSSTKKAYRCYNLRSNKIIESTNVIVYDTKPRRIQIQRSVDDEEMDDKGNEGSTQKEEKVEEEESHENENEYSLRSDTKTPSRWVKKNVYVYVTLECIHLYISCIVPRCLFREVSVM